MHGATAKSSTAASTTPEAYRAGLSALVERLKKTAAKIIWAATTLVPEGEIGRSLASSAATTPADQRTEHGTWRSVMNLACQPTSP